MSSTETLTFGPEWLRALSGGSSASSTQSTTSSATATVKFKLAQFRYGREEMLGLFQECNDVHHELLEAPNLISKDTLIPLSLIPLTEEEQRVLSGGISSDTYQRPRGGGMGSFRGRSVPSRGRGRGRGEIYARSMSQIENGSGPPYTRGGGREYNRRESWDDRNSSRNNRNFDALPSRKPIRRSDASEDWRSDVTRGSGDGGDVDNRHSDWKPPAPSKRESWRDTGKAPGNWRGNSREWPESRERRTDDQSQSNNSKFDASEQQGDSGLMPEWADDGGEEVGGFVSSGASLSNNASVRKKVVDQKNDDKRAPSTSSGQFPIMQEREKAEKNLENENEKEISDEIEKLLPHEVDVTNSKNLKNNIGNHDKKISKPDSVILWKQGEVPETDSRTQPVTKTTSSGDIENAPIFKSNIASVMPSIEELSPNIAKEIDIQVTATKKDTETSKENTDTVEHSEQSDQGEVDHFHSHIEQAALKLVDSLYELDEHSDWTDSKIEMPQPINLPSPVIPSNLTSNVPVLASKWFYKDPQGDTQGPFSWQEMRDWFLGGFFTPSLLVKRACDPQFLPLGELIASWGVMPFDPKYRNLPMLYPKSDAQRQLEIKHHNQLQQRQLLQQQQILEQQQQIIRNYEQKQATYNKIMTQLSTSDEFVAMSLQQQQATVTQYMHLLQQQQQTSTLGAPVGSSTQPIHSVWDSDSMIVRKPSLNPTVSQQQQQQVSELLKQEALEQQQAAAKRKQEEELRQREEEKRKELAEQEKLRKEQEEVFRCKQEGLMKLRAEEIRRKEVAEAKRRQMELEEQERIRKEDEDRRKREELKKKEEEKAAIAKLKEEARRKKEQEEELSRIEALKRQEEMRQRAIQEEARQKMELKKEKEKKRQEEQERIKQLKLLEEEKKAQEEALKKQRQIEIQRQREEALKKRQQDQLKDMKLPSTANWGQQSSQAQQKSASSVAEILKLEEEKERKRKEQELRQLKQQQAQQQQQQQQQQCTAWKSATTNVGASNASTKSHPMSLMEIQREETRKQQQKKPQPLQPKPNLSFQAAATWGTRQQVSAKPSGTSAWGPTVSQPQRSVAYWDQAATTAKSKNNKPKSQAKPRGKQGAGVSAVENSKVMDIFQQSEQSESPFVQWCKEQMSSFPASENLDVSTFVDILRDEESPYEVRNYVVSYLGESKACLDFAERFIEKRAALSHQQQNKQTIPIQQISVTTNTWQTIGGGNIGSDVVTGKTKRGKRKQKKLQKVDPSILGFSVNAASDRVNMGEIDTPSDR